MNNVLDTEIAVTDARQDLERALAALQDAVAQREQARAAVTRRLAWRDPSYHSWS